MKKEYPLVIKLFLMGVIILDCFVFFHGIVKDNITWLYAIFIFPCLFNAWEASEENDSSDLPMFIFLDLVLVSTFLIAVLSLLINNIFMFWCSLTAISFLYMMWNIVYLKQTGLSEHLKRTTKMYNKIWVFSIVLNVLFLILYKLYNIRFIEYYMIILFFPWVITMYIWYRDRVLNICKIDFSIMNVKCYSFDTTQPDCYIKKIEFDKNGEITKIIKKNNVENSNIDYYMLPGLIDSHMHIADSPYQIITPDAFLKEDFNVTLERVKRNLTDAIDVGITSIKDFGSVEYKNIHMLKNIYNKLGTEYPRVFTSGCYICDQRKGHFMDKGGIIIKNVTDAKRLADYLEIQMKSFSGSRYVKFMLGLTSDENPADKMQCFKDTFFEIASVFKERNFVVSVHAYRNEDAELCFRESNGKIESCVDIIEHIGDYSQELLEKIKVTGVILTTTYLSSIDGINISNPQQSVSEDTEEEILVKWHEDVKRLLPNLILDDYTIALGSDSGLYGTPCNALVKEIDCVASLLGDDLSEEEKTRKALELSYINSAKALSMQNKIGKIKVSYNCDFVLYDRDPLKDRSVLENPVAVYIGGKRVK